MGGLIAFILISTASLYFLWKIQSITFKHWKWREDPLARRVKEKLTREEWDKVKKYGLYFVLSMAGGLALFILLSFLNKGPL